MSDLNYAALSRAADLMERDGTLALVPAIELASKDDGPLGALNASHALNTYLEFPNGTWWEWEAERSRFTVISTLRDAANSIVESVRKAHAGQWIDVAGRRYSRYHRTHEEKDRASRLRVKLVLGSPYTKSVRLDEQGPERLALSDEVFAWLSLNAKAPIFIYRGLSNYCTVSFESEEDATLFKIFYT